MTRDGKLKPSEYKEIVHIWDTNGIILIYPHGTLTFAHKEASSDLLTAPFQPGAASLAFKRNIPILVSAIQLCTNRWSTKLVVRHARIVQPYNFSNAEELNLYLEHELNREVRQLHSSV